MDESVYALTGVPSFKMRHTAYPADRAWELFKEFDEKKYIMTCANFKSQHGLIAGHAYTLIATAEYNGERLVKVRNPWGKNYYNHTWSNSDTANWTIDAK
jgi:hypothetical protein